MGVHVNADVNTNMLVGVHKYNFLTVVLLFSFPILLEVTSPHLKGMETSNSQNFPLSLSVMTLVSLDLNEGNVANR